VHIGRAQIGVVTSGMRSPILGKNIALARVDALNAEIGTEVEIGKLDGHQKRLPALPQGPRSWRCTSKATGWSPCPAGAVRLSSAASSAGGATITNATAT
jgi:glycine cleavage system aminomethyltransferase T